MKRREVLESIFKLRPENSIVISTTGLIGRECFELVKNDRHFYMAGSMGLVSSIALGIALNKPRVIVIGVEGDGSILMNFGGLITVGVWKPKNFIHIVLDNSSYDSTGGMKTYSPKVKLEHIAKVLGYEHTTVVYTLSEFETEFKKSIEEGGPVFIRVVIEKGGKRNLPRPKNLKEIADSIRNFLQRW